MYRDRIEPSAMPLAAGALRRSRRAKFLTWLRKTHLYLGLWGAVLGLLFGVTGIVLTHRAILKLPIKKTEPSTLQLAAPAPGFQSPEQLSKWVQAELGLQPVAPPLLRKEPAKTLTWGEREVQQPEKWMVNMNRPGKGVAAEYFVGNRYVKVDVQDATVIGFLTRLHTSTGVNAFWVVLADTIAGCFILLSITGLLLWTQFHAVKTATVLVACGALTWATLFLVLA